MTDLAEEPAPAWCEHGPGAHDGGASSHATAPVASRAWLLIEHPGPWGHSAVETALPGPLAGLAAEADRIGIRVQLIRRPRDTGSYTDAGAPAVFTAWTCGPAPWVRRVDGNVRYEEDLDLIGIAEGVPPNAPAKAGPLYLVCTHARRDRCCGRFGGALAREIGARYPEQTWETTHLGGHKHAANLALLPHGLYYGPVDLQAALGAIKAYEAGSVVAHRYRGRAGHNQAWQLAEQADLLASGGTAKA